jgi:hypothetical protein
MFTNISLGDSQQTYALDSHKINQDKLSKKKVMQFRKEIIYAHRNNNSGRDNAGGIAAVQRRYSDGIAAV